MEQALCCWATGAQDISAFPADGHLKLSLVSSKKKKIQEIWEAEKNRDQLEHMKKYWSHGGKLTLVSNYVDILQTSAPFFMELEVSGSGFRDAQGDLVGTHTFSLYMSQ